MQRRDTGKTISLFYFLCISQFFVIQMHVSVQNKPKKPPEWLGKAISAAFFCPFAGVENPFSLKPYM